MIFGECLGHSSKRSTRSTGSGDSIDECLAGTMSESLVTGHSAGEPPANVPSLLHRLDSHRSLTSGLVRSVDEIGSSPWCHVWLIDLSVEDLPQAYLEGMLSSNEVHQAAYFTRHRDRIAFILCRAGLRRLLSVWLGVPALQIEIVAQRGRKPRLSGFSALSFNISHTAGLGAIAIFNGGEVGVDIEMIEAFNQNPSFADIVLTSNELYAYNNMIDWQKPAFLAKCWTGKEAFLKAIGTGLSIPMARVFMPPPAFHVLDELVWSSDLAVPVQTSWLARWRGYAFALVVLGNCAGLRLRGLLRVATGRCSEEAAFPEVTTGVIDEDRGGRACDLFSLFEIEDLGDVEFFAA